jgi:hypothetical protein
MAFPDFNPGGYTSAITTITASVMNNLRTYIQRALDMTDAGTYDMTGDHLTWNSSTSRQVRFGLQVVPTTNGQIGGRYYSATDADETIEGGAYEVVVIPSTLTANRTYTINATSPVPMDGKTIVFARNVTGSTPSAHTVAINAAGMAGVELTFAASAKFGCVLCYAGGAWRVISASSDGAITWG